MSQEDLFKAIQRCQSEPAFCESVQNDLDGTLRSAGLNLAPNEREQLKTRVQLVTSFRQPGFLPTPEFQQPPPIGVTTPFSPPLAQKFMEEQHDFMIRAMNLRFSLTEQALGVIKTTFARAGKTFSAITWMNRVMFGVGVGLFVFAAYLSMSTHAQVYSLLFGGLGATSFITLFMLDPINRTQRALANLVQVQVVFMTYFDQVTWWENFAQMAQAMPPDPSKIERASAALQQRTLETLELLQRFVEEAKRPARARRDKESRKLEGHPAPREAH